MNKKLFQIPFLLFFLFSCSSQTLYIGKKTGAINKAKLFEIEPTWEQWYKQYQVRKKLDMDSTDLHFLIVGATWCHDSSREMPRLLKVLKESGIKDEQIEIYLTNRKKTEPKEIIKEYKVFFTPTIVVLNKGKEIKRFVENPNTTLEDDLEKIAKALRSE